jgi:hypothetical protein
MLNVNVVSGGGGGGAGDASAANQLIQIQIAEDSNAAIYSQLEVQTDRLLFDLDVIANRLHDIEGNVIVTNQITGYATSQLQESSNIAQWTKLNLIEQSGEISATYLQAIDTHLTPLQQGVARYTLDAKTTLAPDTVPSYSAPPSGIPASEGWYYKNLALGNASQLYYYGNQSSQTQNHDYTISAIQSQWAVVRILNLNSATGIPFLVVYSQPQGSGDHIPGFARSVWTYQVATGQDLRLGEKVIIFRGTLPDSRVFPELRRVECSLTTTSGPGLTSELLAYATVNTDSSAAVGNAEYIIGGAGLSFAGDHVYKVELTAESTTVAAGDASSANQVLQLNAATNSNLAVCSRLDNANSTISSSNLALASRLTTLSSNIGQLYYSGSNLLVRDSQVSSEIASLNSTIGQGISVVMDSNPPISGGMRLFGADSNLFVYDAQTHGELLTLNSQLDGVIDDAAGALKVVGDFYQASQPVIFESPQSVNLYSGGAALTYTQTGASQYSLDVNVNNSTAIPVSGSFYQQTQPVSIEKLSFTAGDELIVYDDYSFQELQTLNGKVVLCDTGNVVISGTVPISSASALSVTETNPITDYATETTSALIKAQTDKLSFYEDQYGAFDLRTQVTNQVATNVQTMPAITVAEGQTIGLVSGTQVVLASGSSVSVSGDIGLTMGTQVGIDPFNNTVNVSNFPTKQSVFVENTAEGFDINVNVTNSSLAITASSTLDTNITNTSLDVHGYASSDGTTWHHLASDANGRLNVNARAHDGAGNDITSTAVSGTETWRGLDVAVKNAVAITGAVNVQNATGTTLAIKSVKYGSWGNVYNNQASVLPSGVSSSIDVSDWTYFIGWYQDYTSGTGTGSIYLEYSFDNITFYRIFNTTIFPSGSSPRTATIYKTDLGGIKYIRMNNATSQTLTSVTLTLFGASN